MANLLIGSLCLTDILEKEKQGHSDITVGKNGKKYLNINIWINDTPDKFGNTVSIQLNSVKDKRESEGKVYIGNAKSLTPPTPAQQSQPEPYNDLGF